MHGHKWPINYPRIVNMHVTRRRKETIQEEDTLRPGRVRLPSTANNNTVHHSIAPLRTCHRERESWHYIVLLTLATPNIYLAPATN